MRHVFAAVVLVLLLGCAREPDRVLTLAAESGDPAIVAEAERILMARFLEFRPSFFSSIESSTTGSEITFVFKRGAPDPAVLEYLYGTPGVFRVSLADGLRRELFAGGDVRDAALLVADSTYNVALRLTPEAGARVMRLTSENVGRVATATLDGEVLMEAVITAPFGETLQITLGSGPKLELVAVLRSGALPTRVSPAGRLRSRPGGR